MTDNPECNQKEDKYDITSQLSKKDEYFRITIDYLSEQKLKELYQILETYYKSKDWCERIYPNHITVEKRQGTDLSKCGRDGCMNLILSFDSFCSEYCLKNYVSLDEDEMK